MAWRFRWKKLCFALFSERAGSRYPKAGVQIIWWNIRRIDCAVSKSSDNTTPKIDRTLLELNADLFSRHASPLEVCVFCGGRRNR